MSWYISSIGKRAAVISEVESVQTMPPVLKCAIAETIRGSDEANGDMVGVEGSGHDGGGRSSIDKLRVDYFHSAKEAAPSVAETPAP